MKKALIVIAQKGYQDRELEGTRHGLKDAAYVITIASTASGACEGKLGGSEEAAIALNDVAVDEYDVVAFIGGPGAHALAEDAGAHRIAWEAMERGKILGAICIAPLILAAAGVLKGKRATVWNEDGQQESILTNAGASYTAEPVTIDGKLVTANGPAAAEAFGATLGRME